MHRDGKAGLGRGRGLPGPQSGEQARGGQGAPQGLEQRAGRGRWALRGAWMAGSALE